MSPAASLLDQLRAPNVDGEQEHVRASNRGLVLWSLGLSGLLVLLLRALLPTGMSDDGVLYRSLAEDPFDNPLILESPNIFHATFAMRLLVPLTVWALPVDPDLGFHLTAAGGLVAGAVVVSLLARKLGLGGLALLAGPVYVASFHGIYGLWQIYHVDTVTMALFSAGVLAAYTQRAVLCSVLSAFVVASKEIGLALPLAWWASRRGRGGERRAILETLLVAALPVALFVVMRFTIVLPHQPWRAWEQYKLGFTTQGEWGYARPLVQVLLQNHGMLWLLWPLGLLVGPPRWRRLHLFVLLLLPLLAGGPWARSTAYLAPFVLPSALVVLSRVSLLRGAIALAGSAAVAVPLALRNSAVEEAGSNLLLLPGIVVFLVAAFPAARSALEAAPLDRVPLLGPRIGRSSA
jgi:hypothetical protein